MWRRILTEAAVVLIGTATLLALTATIGVERGERPRAMNAPRDANVSPEQQASPGASPNVRLCPLMHVAERPFLK